MDFEFFLPVLVFFLCDLVLTENRFAQFDGVDRAEFA